MRLICRPYLEGDAGRGPKGVKEAAKALKRADSILFDLIALAADGTA